MMQKIDIRKSVHNWSVRRKKQEKIQYNTGVKIQFFNPSNFILFGDLTLHLRKLTERWQGSFFD